MRVLALAVALERAPLAELADGEVVRATAGFVVDSQGFATVAARAAAEVPAASTGELAASSVPPPSEPATGQPAAGQPDGAVDSFAAAVQNASGKLPNKPLDREVAEAEFMRLASDDGNTTKSYNDALDAGDARDRGTYPIPKLSKEKFRSFYVWFMDQANVPPGTRDRPTKGTPPTDEDAADRAFIHVSPNSCREPGKDLTLCSAVWTSIERYFFISIDIDTEFNPTPEAENRKTRMRDHIVCGQICLHDRARKQCTVTDDKLLETLLDGKPAEKGDKELVDKLIGGFDWDGTNALDCEEFVNLMSDMRTKRKVEPHGMSTVKAYAEWVKNSREAAALNLAAGVPSTDPRDGSDEEDSRNKAQEQDLEELAQAGGGGDFPDLGSCAGAFAVAWIAS